MTAQRVSIAAALLLAVTVASGCGSKATTVDRIDPATVTDVSGQWNDTDSRLVAEEMINDALSYPWARLHTEASGGRRPTVVIGRVRNLSHEHVNVNTFVRDMVRAFVRTGLARVVTSGDERDQVRDERQDQQDYASPETRRRLRNELGADFMLLGEINTIFDREGGLEVKYYQVDLNLTDLESNELVWVGQHKIKKIVERRRYRP